MPDSIPDAPHRPRPGGRSARVVENVLKAAFEVLAKQGAAAFTIAEVASRAGVHETSIYRRWQTRSALALDACLHVVEKELIFPDTGTLKGDLRLFLRRLIKLIESPLGRALLSLGATGTQSNTDLRTKFWETRLAAASAIVERAKQRREIRDDVEAVVFLEILAGPIYFRAMITGESLRKWPLDEVIDRIVLAFRP